MFAWARRIHTALALLLCIALLLSSSVPAPLYAQNDSPNPQPGDDAGETFLPLTPKDGVGEPGGNTAPVTPVPPPTATPGPATPRIMRTSPANGEDGVAVTRETIIEFSEPLKASTVKPAAFTAQFGYHDLPFRLHLSKDRLRVTLFYEDNLPGSARIRVTVDGERMQTANDEAVDPDGDGQPGGTQMIEFNTLSLTAVAGTAVCGRVFASEVKASASGAAVNVPLQNVTITVDGAESTLNTRTDATGNFCLDPAPVGRFFVHVDGRTATGIPNGAYYPYVGKAWESRAGQQINAGDVYLPLVVPGTLQPVSEAQETMIRLPDQVLEENPNFANVMISVPADSLYSDDGTRGGQVGIAPVPPDRLPGQLPDGLDFPVVITVQTDGATNFDVPAPVCFPNLPDPDTGEKLRAGEKSALWSFDHDVGSWSVVGPMTVNSDATLVCTDPGVGVRAPGWHGAQPGSQGRPPAEECDLTAAQQTQFVLDIAEEAAKCLASATGIGASIDAVFKLSAEVRSIIQSLESLQNSIDEDSTVGEVKASMQIIQSLKNSAKTAYDLINKTTLGKISAVSKCAESVLALIEKYCGKKQDRGAECVQGWLAVLCVTASTSRSVLTQINNLVEVAQESLKRISLELLCSKLDQAAVILGLLPSTSTVNAQQVLSDDDPVPPEVLELLDEAYNESQALLTDLEILEEYLGLTEELLDNLEEIQEEAEQLAENPVENLPPNAYYLVEVANQSIRGISSDQGHFEVMLPAERPYTFSMYDAATSRLGVGTGETSSAGDITVLPALHFSTSYSKADADADLPDVIENVVGTNPGKPDTDTDGVFDGIELQNGTDPLDGIAAQTGLVGTVDTPGTAVDVCVHNDLAVIADSDAGVSLFNIFDNMNPSIIAQMDTPGVAQAIACTDDLVAVADKAEGVALIDVSDLTSASIRHQIALSGDAQAVAFGDGVLYAGTAGDQLSVIDSNDGQILGQLNVGQEIEEIAVAGDALYVLTESSLIIYGLWDGGWLERGRLPVSGSTSPLEFGRKLFVGGNYAYVGYFTGYSVIDVRDASNPVLVGTPPETQAAIHGLASNGSGELVAITSFSGASTLAVSLYDDSDPTDVTQFLTSFETPGTPRAAAIYNGLAYVAAGDGGLQVVNYLSYDTGNNAPTLSLTTGFAEGKAEENKVVPITAGAQDDVQVRLVEFYIDGDLVATDASYPFEVRVRTPRMADQPTFTLRARAVDTGGNESWSDAQTLTLVPDATPPRVLRHTPALAVNPAGSVRVISATFNEAIKKNTLTAANFQLISAGPDKLLDTGDDAPVTGGSIAFDDDENIATRTLGSALPAGLYRARVTKGVTDLAGNSVVEAHTWSLGVGNVLPIGEVIQGEIAVDGEQDVYTFTAVPNQRMYFDDQGTSNAYDMRWRVLDSSGAAVFNSTFGNNDPGAYILELGGTYTVEIWADAGETGTYQFELRSNPPDEFTIQIGDVIKSGSPGPGAGHVELPGNYDAYEFQATAGQRVYFDDRDASDAFDFFWWVTDSSGTQIFRDTFDDSDPGVRVLERGGTYRIEVWASSNVAGTYEFQLRSNPPDEFTINIGDVVRNGQPGAGAGNVEIPGNYDRYRFQATAGQRIYFDDRDSSDAFDFFWEVTDSSGTRIFRDTFDNSDPGVRILEKGGTYLLDVWASNNVAGTYEFQLRSNPPDEFTINIGDVVRDGQPGAGAGNVEIPGNYDVYRFQATPGQRVYFDDRNASDAYDFDWEVTDAAGTRIFSDSFEGSDPGVRVLELGGTYTIVVWASNNVAGTYEFQIRSNPPDTFAIDIGDIVQNGQPGAGAGNVEIPGNFDRYTFTATPGQRVYFDDQNASDPYDFSWEVTDSNGERVLYDRLDGADQGVKFLELGGTYTIDAWADNNVAGTYQFQMRSNPPHEFNIAIGDTVQNGQPGQGAGNIEIAGNQDIYRFQATPGQQVYFDDQGSSRLNYFYWEVWDANGSRVFYDDLDNYDPGMRTLTLGGEYTIYAYAATSTDGTYQFQLRLDAPADAASMDDAPPEDNVPPEGESVPEGQAPPADGTGTEAGEGNEDDSDIYLPVAPN